MSCTCPFKVILIGMSGAGLSFISTAESDAVLTFQRHGLHRCSNTARDLRKWDQEAISTLILRGLNLNAAADDTGPGIGGHHNRGARGQKLLGHRFTAQVGRVLQRRGPTGPHRQH